MVDGIKGGSGPQRMVALRNILVATDFSECSAHAVDDAMGIAKRYQARLYLFHWVDPMVYNLIGPEAVGVALEAACRDMRELEQGLRVQGLIPDLPIETVVEEAGDLPSLLSRIVRDRHLDLIVVGTHGRTGFKRLALGSVAEKIFREAPRPVLTVGPHVYRSRIWEAGPENILLATDLSLASRLADQYAFSLAYQCGARLAVLDLRASVSGNPLAREAQAEWCNQRLAELAIREEELVARPEWTPGIGARVEAALRIAEEKAVDLIVFTVSAPYQFTHRFLETEAYRMVCEAPCPVLTVHVQC